RASGPSARPAHSAARSTEGRKRETAWVCRCVFVSVEGRAMKIILIVRKPPGTVPGGKRLPYTARRGLAMYCGIHHLFRTRTASPQCRGGLFCNNAMEGAGFAAAIAGRHEPRRGPSARVHSDPVAAAVRSL